MTYFKVVFLMLIAVSATAQVGINTKTPDASSALDIDATNKGLLIPRIALLSPTDTSTIALPANSLLVFNTTNNASINEGYYYWNSTSWIKLIDTPTRLFQGNSNPNSTFPVSSIAGDVYVNSTTGTLFVYNGTNWISQNSGVNILTAMLIAIDGQTEFTTPWEVNLSNTKVYRNGVNISFTIISSNVLKIENDATCYPNDEIKILKFL